jgi:ferritin-like metal-binding protein YciE
MPELNDLRDLLHHEVQVMYSAEKLIMAGLPRMIEKATNPQLKAAFETHLRETSNQADCLKEVAEMLGVDEDGDASTGIKGLIAEGEKVMKKNASPEAMDAALICAAQKIEHYEIAGYGTAVHWAQELGLDQIARMLDDVLAEEKKTDQILTSLAKSIVNVQAE